MVLRISSSRARIGIGMSGAHITSINIRIVSVTIIVIMIRLTVLVRIPIRAIITCVTISFVRNLVNLIDCSFTIMAVINMTHRLHNIDMIVRLALVVNYNSYDYGYYERDSDYICE